MESISDQTTKQTSATAEGGIARYISFLTRYPAVAVLCANAGAAPCNAGVPTWATTTANNWTSGCAAGNMTGEDITNINNHASTAWQDFSGNNDYRLVGYVFQPDAGTASAPPGDGILTVEGRTSDVGGSTTRIEVRIPISSTGECPIPGVWAQSSGTVKVSPHATGSLNAIVTRTGTTPIPSGDFPDDSLNGSTIYDGTTAPVQETTILTMPTVPATIPAGYKTVFSTGTATNGYLDLNGCTIRLPRKGGEQNAWGTCPDTIKTGFNGGTGIGDVLPNASADVAAPDDRYHYLIPSSGVSGGDSIRLYNAAIKIEPDSGKKVVLYLRGNISNMSGTDSNGTSPAYSLATSASRDSNPTNENGLGCEMTQDSGTAAVTTFINQGTARNLEIYGADGTASPHWSDGHTSTMISVSGNTRINGFLLFPEAQVVVSQGLISGSVWAKTFDFTNTSGCTVGMAQNSVGSILAISNSSARINPVTSWHRKEVEATP
jgi:hypothetical protein